MRSAAIRTVTMLLCAALLAVVPVGASAQDEARRLEEARSALQRIATEVEGAEAELGDAESRLADADAHLAEVEQIVNEVAAEVEEQRAAVGDAHQRVTDVEQESSELTEAFEERISRMYKQGPELTFELLLSAPGADEAIARTVLLERVAEGDQVDLERLAAAATAVETEHGRLRDEQQELEELLDEQEEVLAQAQTLRESRALATADARERLQGLQHEHDDLVDEEARLEELIREQQREAQRRREAERRAAEQRAAEERAAQQRNAPPSSPAPTSSDDPPAPPSSPPVNQGSGHAWPMCAPVTSEYGPRWGRMHRGIDLGASTGTPIRASRGGTVIFAGWQGGYGNLTLVDHGGGVVTAYAHQSGFAASVGAGVSQGQTIGYVGSTGNSTGPHLHFEVRINGSAVNPRQYLSGSPC